MTIDDTAATVLTGPWSSAVGNTGRRTVGDYAITQGTLAANSNYTITFTGSTLTITPATLTIAAKPETKVYGSADPTLAYTASGFQFSDTAATVLTGASAGGRRDGLGRSLRDQPGNAGGQQQLHDPLHRQFPDHHPGTPT